jgi:hypothetical protein
MHLIVYFNPRIIELVSQIDSRRQGGSLQGLVLLVPRRAPIVLNRVQEHFGESKFGANSKINLNANGLT